MLLAALMLGGCTTWSYGRPAVNGVLIDASDQTPVSDAYVVLRWQGMVAHFPSASTECLHVGIAKTDANGAFEVARWKRRISDVKTSEAYFYVYKPGYNVLISGKAAREEFVESAEKVYAAQRINNEEWVESVVKNLHVPCFGEMETLESDLAFYESLEAELRSKPNGQENIEMPPGNFDPPITRVRNSKCLKLATIAGLNPEKNGEASEVYKKCFNQP